MPTPTITSHGRAFSISGTGFDTLPGINGAFKLITREMQYTLDTLDTATVQHVHAIALTWQRRNITGDRPSALHMIEFVALENILARLKTRHPLSVTLTAL